MFLQFELWKQCSLGCKFCYNNGIPRRRDKIASMQKVLDILNSPEVDKYTDFGIIGGEFFNGEIDTPEVKEYFYKIIENFIDKVNKGIAKRCLVTTSLMFDDNTELLEFCNYLKEANVEDKFMICTSYDLAGRFNDKKLKNWQDNMILLHLLYPNIRLHVETIVTQTFLEAVLSGQFDIKQFNKTYHCFTNYMLPMTGYSNLYKNMKDFEDRLLPNFFPRRETFLEFLQYTHENQILTRDDLENFVNIINHSDTCYTSFDDKDFYLMEDRHNLEYKRNAYCDNDNYGYFDSDIHPRDDIENFLEMTGE